MLKALLKLQFVYLLSDEFDEILQFQKLINDGRFFIVEELFFLQWGYFF